MWLRHGRRAAEVADMKRLKALLQYHVSQVYLADQRRLCGSLILRTCHLPCPARVFDLFIMKMIGNNHSRFQPDPHIGLYD